MGKVIQFPLQADFRSVLAILTEDEINGLVECMRYEALLRVFRMKLAEGSIRFDVGKHSFTVSSERELDALLFELHFPKDGIDPQLV